MTTQLIQLPEMTRTARAVKDMRAGVYIPQTTAAERAKMQLMHAKNRELQSRIQSLEAAEAARQEALIVKAQRLAYMESKTAHVRDNTASYKKPAVIATTDAVHLTMALNPRKAIPMVLPVLSVIRNWLHRKW
jgi:hypothetical protein